MKRTLVHALIMALVMLPFAGVANAVETYLLDPVHTTVTWSVNHVGQAPQTGKVSFVQGSLNLDMTSLEDSKIFAVMLLTQMSTENRNLDAELRKVEWFDADHYPSMGFVSNKVELTGKDTARVYGMLTIRGVSKPEVLNVTLGKGGELANHIKTLAFSATAVIRRSDFGIDKVPDVSDNVQIAVESQVNFLKTQ